MRMIIKTKQFPIDLKVSVIESKIIHKSPNLNIQNNQKALNAEIPELLNDSIEYSSIISKTDIKVMIVSKILNQSLTKDFNPSPINFIKNSETNMKMKIMLITFKN